MKEDKLIPYKENIFTKISQFFKKLFFRKKKENLNNIDEKLITDKNQNENFAENTVIKENEEIRRLKELRLQAEQRLKQLQIQEEIRLKNLKLQYDNEEIDEEDISSEDMDKLIKMYENETEMLNADTERRKNHISQMLKKLKYSQS
ncbi:MAG: hypothetical protein DBY41_01885 [Clostridium sp.]|jgi:DNA repair exonuclease SbcCD nuclease subunit|nr:MAG: hypothetical protein DBY41_01885 [Clostridium sp.]